MGPTWVSGGLISVGAILAVVGFLAAAGVVPLSIGPTPPSTAGMVATFSYTEVNKNVTLTTANAYPCSARGGTNNCFGLSFSAKFAWGDGTVSGLTMILGTGQVSATHAYAANGAQTISEVLYVNSVNTPSAVSSVTVSTVVNVPGTTSGVISSSSAGGNAAIVPQFTFVTSGLSVNFTDTSTATQETIQNVSWLFGDGATAPSVAAGSTVKHTYATAGTYRVKETIFGGAFTGPTGANGSFTVVPSVYRAIQNATVSAPTTSGNGTPPPSNTGTGGVMPPTAATSGGLLFTPATDLLLVAGLGLFIVGIISLGSSDPRLLVIGSILSVLAGFGVYGFATGII